MRPENPVNTTDFRDVLNSGLYWKGREGKFVILVFKWVAEIHLYLKGIAAKSKF